MSLENESPSIMFCVVVGLLCYDRERFEALLEDADLYPPPEAIEESINNLTKFIEEANATI
jgi:hypothetical protein